MEWVQIDLDEAAENNHHLITPEDRWRIAMAPHKGRADAEGGILFAENLTFTELIRAGWSPRG